MDITTHTIFEANTKGRDYFVGDIHGRYTMLIHTLRQMRFDTSKDRLFAVGDLIDRGDENIECVALLDEPWFFSSFGNHEELFLNAMRNPENSHFVSLHVRNGGYWAWEKDPSKEIGVSPTDEALELVDSIATKCPLMMTVKTKQGRIGVVHADCPKVWPDAADTVKFDKRMIWNREKPEEVAALRNTARPYVVHGIDAVIHGHERHPDILRNANRMWIDTATFGDFTILPSGEVMDCVREQLANEAQRLSNSNNPGMG